MSLIPDEFKAELQDAIRSVAETFEREITVYKDAKNVFIAPNNEDFIHIYRRSELNKESSKAPVEFKIMARIYFPPNEDKTESASPAGAGNMKFPVSSSRVRIKIKIEDDHIFKDVKIVKIYDQDFSIVSEPVMIGLFEPRYVSYTLSKKE